MNCRAEPFGVGRPAALAGECLGSEGEKNLLGTPPVSTRSSCTGQHNAHASVARATQQSQRTDQGKARADRITNAQGLRSRGSGFGGCCFDVQRVLILAVSMVASGSRRSRLNASFAAWCFLSSAAFCTFFPRYPPAVPRTTSPQPPSTRQTISMTNTERPWPESKVAGPGLTVGKALKEASRMQRRCSCHSRNTPSPACSAPSPPRVSAPSKVFGSLSALCGGRARGRIKNCGSTCILHRGDRHVASPSSHHHHSMGMRIPGGRGEACAAPPPPPCSRPARAPPSPPPPPAPPPLLLHPHIPAQPDLR